MKTYKDLLNLIENEPSKDLFNKIILRIKKEEKIFIIKKRLLIVSAVLFLSSVAFIFSAITTHTEFIKSGFFDFFSLMFSDFNTIIAYWQNFSMSLLESLPVVSVIIFLFTLIIFISSLKAFSKDIKIFFVYKHAN